MANIEKNSGTIDKKEKIFSPRHHELHPVRQQDRLSMADDAEGLPAAQHCVLLLYEVEARRCVRGHHGHVAGEASRFAQEGLEPKHRHHRLKERQDQPARRQGARHRRQQEGEGAQGSGRGRHAGASDGRFCPRGEHPRQQGRGIGFVQTRPQVPEAEEDYCRRWIQGR